MIEHIPTWLQIVFAVAGVSQPFIILMLTIAHNDRKELLAQVNKINGRIGVLEAWRSWQDSHTTEMRTEIRLLQQIVVRNHAGSE